MRHDLQLRMLASERDTNFSITTTGDFWVVKFGHLRITGENLSETLEQALRTVS